MEFFFQFSTISNYRILTYPGTLSRDCQVTMVIAYQDGDHEYNFYKNLNIT